MRCLPLPACVRACASVHAFFWGGGGRVRVRPHSQSHFPCPAQVKVCVPDSGALMNHPDLAANFGGGFNLIPVDQSNPSSRIPALGSSEFYVFNDTLGHGTHTAGLVAAAGNNGVGVSGVSWNVSPSRGILS